MRERVALDIRQRNALRGQLEGKFAEPVPPRLWLANIRAARNNTMIWRMKAIAASLLDPDRRVLGMVRQMDAEGFGNCTNQYECEAVCPKEIPVRVIADMNREFVRAKVTEE